MFTLFRLKKKAPATANPLQDKMAGKLVATVLRIQRRWAGCMDRAVNSLPVRWKKTGLIVFTALSVLACISIVLETFRHPVIIPVHSVAAPLPRVSGGEPRGSPSIPEQQYQRVKAFHHYMDSLAASVTGRRVFDSISRCRPGLLDSAVALEKLYQQQNKPQ